METTRMDLLVTLDEHYLPQLRVMLTSLHLSHPGVRCRVYLLHRGIPEERLAALGGGLARWDFSLMPIQVDETVFQDAPVTDRYPQEMYYRLLAARFLPEELDRVLYLDPDTLVINSLLPLWELEAICSPRRPIRARRRSPTTSTASGWGRRGTITIPACC